MEDPPKRKILSLKFAVPLPGVPEGPGFKPPPKAPARVSAPKPPPAPAKIAAPAPWKCKPCGKGFDVPASVPDDEDFRCPSCNARLGMAGDFRARNLDRLRARPGKG
jgi:DNA-directed RNA polymerase subunit RPC12/RpoP